MSKRQKLLATFLVSLLSASCATPNTYVPGGVSRSYQEAIYDYRLSLFNESPLVPNRGTQVYRFFNWIVEGNVSLMVRIERTEGETIIVGKIRGSESVDISEELSEADWQAFLLEVYESEFWLSDTRQEKSYVDTWLPRALNLPYKQAASTLSGQGSEWFIEASNGELYHVGSTERSREDPILELGAMMLDLSGIRDYPR